MPPADHRACRAWRGLGTDTQGCINVLTADRAAPSGATTYDSNQLEVEAVIGS